MNIVSDTIPSKFSGYPFALSWWMTEILNWMNWMHTCMISTTATRSANEIWSPAMNGLSCRKFSSNNFSDPSKYSTALSIFSLGTSTPKPFGIKSYSNTRKKNYLIIALKKLAVSWVTILKIRFQSQNHRAIGVNQLGICWNLSIVLFTTVPLNVNKYTSLTLNQTILDPCVRMEVCCHDRYSFTLARFCKSAGYQWSGVWNFSARYIIIAILRDYLIRK